VVNNGSWSYDHDRDGTHTQLAGCEVRFRNVEYETLVSIRYENDILSVSTDLENRNEWKNCFVVANVELPTGYHFGMSATTGDLSDNHDIHSFKFYDLDLNVNVSSLLFAKLRKRSKHYSAVCYLANAIRSARNPKADLSFNNCVYV